MNSVEKQVEKKNNQKIFNITLTAVAGQAGCFTFFIVFAALFGGLWLDNRFQTRPMFTIGLIIASIPVTVLAMLWIVRFTTSHMDQAKNRNNNKIVEEDNSG
jgi:ABC-type transport system involved in cytochrome c biogenesis permease subunit